MTFENHTPFPAIAWPNTCKEGKTHTSIVVRVKYLFETLDESGLWSLKLAKEQEELFDEDKFYENNIKASVLYESDYVTYKPSGDLILNAYAHEKEEQSSWTCGVELLREENGSFHKLLAQKVRVYAERKWHWWLHGWNLYQNSKSKKVALRYENAYGGYSLNPKREEDGELEYLAHYKANPVGKGIIHKALRKGEGEFPAHQIEAFDEKITSINSKNSPQGFGFIHRSWSPRLEMAGTADDKWLKEKWPILPDDFDEAFNNAAHPNLRLKKGSYFQAGDLIIMNKMLKGKEEQGFCVPSFYFKADNNQSHKSSEFFLDIDTIVVEIRGDDMEENCVYISYRKRVETKVNVKKVSLNMIVPAEFKANKEIKKEQADG